MGIFKGSREHYRIIFLKFVFQKDTTILTAYVPKKSIKIHEAKTDRTARRNRGIQYYRLETSTPPLRNRSSRRNISKDTGESNTTINRLVTMDTFRPSTL